MITKTTLVATLHSQLGIPCLRSRCMSVVSLLNGRVTWATAGTGAAGIAGSAGR